MDPKEKDVLDLDRSVLVKDLTLGQLMEVVSYETSRKKLDDLQEQQKKIKDEYIEFNKTVFGDARMLVGTSPFYIKTTDELDRFSETCKALLSTEKKIVMVMGVCDE